MNHGLIRLMVVEDSHEYQGAVKLLLADHPTVQDVCFVDTGEKALREFARVSPDLVLIDFQLPGIDGLETARRMKNMQPDVMIAMLTAHAREALDRPAYEAVVDHVIPKAKLSRARLELLLNP